VHIPRGKANKHPRNSCRRCFSIGFQRRSKFAFIRNGAGKAVLNRTNETEARRGGGVIESSGEGDNRKLLKQPLGGTERKSINLSEE